MLLDAIITNAVLSILLLMTIYALDRQEKEPPGVVARLYLLAILATWLFGKGKLALALPMHSSLGIGFDVFVLAGVLEEALKLALFMALAWRLKCFDEEMDGIVYAMVVAAGFAVMENVYYTLNATYELPQRSGEYYGALFRILAIRALPGHLLFAIVGGYFLGRARFTAGGRAGWIAAALLVPVVLHGTWNLLAYRSIEAFLVYVILLLLGSAGLLVHALRRTRYHRVRRELEGRLDGDLARAEAAGARDLRDALATVRRKLRHLRGLEGHEQDRVLAWMDDRLPDPITSLPAEGDDGSLARLHAARVKLDSYRGRFDLGFLAMFAALLIGPSSLLLLLLTLF